MPITPLSKRTSSEARTFARPEARAMPSPASVTAPTSCATSVGLNARICSSREAVMSLNEV